MTPRISRISPAGCEALHSQLAQIEEQGEPAAWFGVTSAKEIMYFDCLGQKIQGQEEQVDENTLLQLFSATKLVTTIAALQQVDQGRIALDDADQLQKICPELSTMKVLEGFSESGQPILKDAETPITLRMLLNHTSGLAYAFNNPNISRYCSQTGVPDIFSRNAPLEAYIMPLAHQPGSRFCYGIGPDWAGIMVTRLSGLDLEDYFKSYIWQRCDVRSITFVPPKDWLQHGMAMTTRIDGKVSVMEELPLGRSILPEHIGPLYMGGGGLFGTARDYLLFLRGVLRSADPTTPKDQRLITPETYKVLFVDSLPDLPQIKTDLLGMAKQQDIHDPELLADGIGGDIGFAPGLFLNKLDSRMGRKAMSGAWDGAARTYYWLDPTTGVAGVCFTNILNFAKEPFTQVYNRFERTVYDYLL